jgi:hypothetical protein
MFLCVAGRVLDYSSMPSKDHLMNVIATELEEFPPDEEAIIIAAKNDI